MNTLKKRRLAFSILAIVVLITSIAVFMPGAVTVPAHELLNTSQTGSISIIPESQYDKMMTTVVEPSLEKIKHTGTFTTSDNYENYYEYFLVKNPIGTVVISHGLFESINKFYEMIYYFTQAGYNVFGADHTGHGYSKRFVEDLSLVHIETYQQYLDDFTSFIEHVVVPNSTSGTYYLYAHSMGGNIGTLFLEQSPEFFKAAILSTPMMSFHTGNFPKSVAQFIANVFFSIGKGTSYTFSHGPFTGVPDDKSGTTVSQTRYDYYHNKKLEDNKLQTSGTSFGWLKESFASVERVTSKENTEKVKTPILLFQAEKDSLVSPEGHYVFTNQTPNTKLVIVEGAEHELYQANDNILSAYLNRIFNFLEENSL